MDKLSAMQAFVTIANCGSLTAAADQLGKSQPTMVRTLANLERVLGVCLLRRTTRRIALTDEGRDYLLRCERILADVREAEASLASHNPVPTGELRITAPVTFGQRHVAPALVDFVRAYPQVQVELMQLDRPVNLLEEGLDLGVRIGHLPDSTMIASRVGWMRRVTVASPSLLERLGEPEDPIALSGLPCVRFRGLTLNAWQFVSQGREVSVPVTGPFTTNQATSAVNACIAGLGFGQFLCYQIEPAARSGDLKVILEPFEAPPYPVNLVYAESRLMSPRLRACLDHLRGALTESLGQIANGLK